MLLPSNQNYVSFKFTNITLIVKTEVAPIDWIR